MAGAVRAACVSWELSEKGLNSSKPLWLAFVSCVTEGSWKGFTSTGSANGLVSKLDMWAVPAGRRRSAPRCRLPPFPHRFRGRQRACAERHVTSACVDAA